MSNFYACIEGNIGAGKTTFTKRFAELSNANTILEQFSENPFLELFYQNPVQYAFPLEMSFLSERFQQLNTIFSKPDLFATSYVADYCFIKTLIFAKQNLAPEEFELFKNFYKILNQKLPKPNFIIYLHTDLDYLRTNITSRGRNYEQNINPNYLTGISDGYKSILLSRHDIPILLLPYTQESWNEADEIILKILTAVKLSKFKNGLQIFS